MITTSYGTYYNAEGSSLTVEDDIAQQLDVWADDFDVDAIVKAVRDEINEQLAGTGIMLCGNEFYGPAYPDAEQTAAQARLTDMLWDGDEQKSAPDSAVRLAWEWFWDIAEAHAWTGATVTLPSDVAAYIADTLAQHGPQPDISGGTITLTMAHLARLGDLPEDCDGHYDGEFVWVGGTEYSVTKATRGGE